MLKYVESAPGHAVHEHYAGLVLFSEQNSNNNKVISHDRWS